MNGTSARIELASEVVAAGENLTGRVLPGPSAFAKAAADPSAPDAALAVEILWRTSGLCEAEEKVVLSQTLKLAGPQETPFQLKVPAAGPMSYAGKTFSITWCVRIASERPAERAFTVVAASRKPKLL